MRHDAAPHAGQAPWLEQTSAMRAQWCSVQAGSRLAGRPPAIYYQVMTNGSHLDDPPHCRHSNVRSFRIPCTDNRSRSLSQTGTGVCIVASGGSCSACKPAGRRRCTCEKQRDGIRERALRHQEVCNAGPFDQHHAQQADCSSLLLHPTHTHTLCTPRPSRSL